MFKRVRACCECDREAFTCVALMIPAPLAAIPIGRQSRMNGGDVCGSRENRTGGRASVLVIAGCPAAANRNAATIEELVHTLPLTQAALQLVGVKIELVLATAAPSP